MLASTPLSLPTDVVLVPVPIAALDAVLRARDAAIGGGATAASANAVTLGHNGWTEPMLREFADRVTYPLVIALFDACAADPGAWIPKSQIDGDTTPIQLRNELGAMSKLINRTHGKDFPWPIDYRKVQGRYEYRLDAETAAAWSEIRAGSDQQ